MYILSLLFQPSDGSQPKKEGDQGDIEDVSFYVYMYRVLAIVQLKQGGISFQTTVVIDWGSGTMIAVKKY